MSNSEVEVQVSSHEQTPKLSEKELKVVIGKIINVLFSLRNILILLVRYGTDLDLDFQKLIARRFWTMYKDVLEVLIMLKREDLLKKIGDVQKFSEVVHDLLEEVRRGAKLFEDGYMMIDIFQYLPYMFRLVLNVVALIKNILMRVVGPIPEVETLLQEIKQIASKMLSTDIVQPIY